MTGPDVDASATNGAPAVPASAGELLRTTREASGMTIDAVAQQLKLAPRQVRALEEGDYSHLPGRTFIRGFMRNYARLLRLDANVVLAALPAAAAAPDLDSPALHATAPTIGELPTTEPARHGWTRWAIPLTLVAIIAATAVWEWLHPAADSPRAVAKKEAPTAPERAKLGTPEIVGTPLPNPVASYAPPVVVAVPEKAVAMDAAPAVGSPKADAVEPAGSRLEGTPVAGGAVPADAPLLLEFRDFSWTEVRDRSGRVLLSRMNAGGTTQSLAGTPPLELVIGNAADVTLTWKSRHVDLAPHTRPNVARLTLE